MNSYILSVRSSSYVKSNRVLNWLGDFHDIVEVIVMRIFRREQLKAVEARFNE